MTHVVCWNVTHELYNKSNCKITTAEDKLSKSVQKSCHLFASLLCVHMTLVCEKGNICQSRLKQDDVLHLAMVLWAFIFTLSHSTGWHQMFRPKRQRQQRFTTGHQIHLHHYTMSLGITRKSATLKHFL